MKVIISRTYNLTETLGTLFVMDGEKELFKCKTIELPFLGNKKNVSCIPEGKYDCTRIISPTKGHCFSVQNVPDRDSILIHAGNYVKGDKIDSKGCILVGSGFCDINKDGFIDIINSTLTLNKLLSLLTEFKLLII